MLNLTLKQLETAEFRLYEGNPVIRCFGASPVVADPSVVVPEDALDGKWHLFAHTLTGVHGFISDDGISFAHTGKVVARAMRPDIKKIKDGFVLLYERLQPLPARAASLAGGTWKSEIYAVKSHDLISFSEPYKVLGFDRDFEKVGKRGFSLSNPFLTESDDGFVLYYSSGLTYVPDCKFSEPTFICRAVSAFPDRDFVKDSAPLIVPDPDSKLFNLCCGCLKVYRLADGYAGIQNGIYRENGKSRSAIQLLRSDDGKKFEFVKTLLSPCIPDNGSRWMAQFVYASHLVRTGDELRLYFNARNTAFILTGREHIGFAYASLGMCRTSSQPAFDDA